MKKRPSLNFFFLFFAIFGSTLLGCGFQVKNYTQADSAPLYFIKKITNETDQPGLDKILETNLRLALERLNLLTDVEHLADRKLTITLTQSSYSNNTQSTSTHYYYLYHFQVTANLKIDEGKIPSSEERKTRSSNLQADLSNPLPEKRQPPTQKQISNQLWKEKDANNQTLIATYDENHLKSSLDTPEVNFGYRATTKKLAQKISLQLVDNF